MVGGYRDLKIIGKFGAEIGTEMLFMVVEVQVIDSVFVSIKKYMQLPYTITRGDFHIDKMRTSMIMRQKRFYSDNWQDEDTAQEGVRGPILSPRPVLRAGQSRL